MLVLQHMCWANQCWQLLEVSGPLESTTRVQEAIITFHPSQSQIEGGVPALFKRFLAPWENSTDGNGKYPLLILILTLVPPMACLLCGRGRRGSFAYTVNSISISELIKPFWRAAGHRRRVSTAWPRRCPSGAPLKLWHGALPSADTFPHRPFVRWQKNSHFAEGERRRQREILHFSSALFGDSMV